MPSSRFNLKLAKFVALLGLPVCLLAWLLLCAPVGHGQNPNAAQPGPQRQGQPEVLRVYTDLVQTDVMVFDKQGHFVNGLKSSDFELRIDGQPKPVEFFEKITAGSIDEESQIAAARGASTRLEGNKSNGPAPLDRGRPIFFYVDDMHMDLPSLVATRKLIARFIDKEMGQNDEAAIASANGQIGFLQQLTDNKAVLRAALARLKLRPYAVRDYERPPMSEYQGLRITQGDADIMGYFVDATLRENPGMTAETAEAIVASRARALVQQGAYITVSTFTGLEGLVRSANKLPGRKLVFFVSGGFLIDDLNSDLRYRLQRITSAAARSGVVIYSIDARGLIASLTDASDPGQPDPSGRLQRGAMSEISATQDGMNALASDTGGKATFNTNALEPSLRRALNETSNYYLLAWKPDTQTQQTSKFRHIEVKVIGKPNLIVQVRRGFFDQEPETVKKSAKASKSRTTKARDESEAARAPEVELRKVMTAPYPDRGIPISLSLNYIHTPGKGALLSTVLQAPNEFFSFEPVNGKPTAVVTVAGTVFDDKGNPGAAFSNRVTIAAPSAEAAREGHDLTYGYPVYVSPGLYQVRVGVRDEKTGRTGTAHGWIEIPDLSSGQLALSSLLMGLRAQPEISTASTERNVPLVDLSVAHNFSANGYLRFLVIVYNAAIASTDAKPDVAIQVQLVRDNQPVVTAALKKVAVKDLVDLTRIPYAAELSLSGLPPGRYVLHVTVVDRVAKKSASQETRFDLE